MGLMNIFMMPKPVNVKGRTSSITNAFVNGIVPCVYPSEEQIKESLNILKIDPDDLRCAFCGDPATEWDHLRPLVKGKKPTGYISEIHNLVPACGKCNQSKGNKEWRKWIVSKAKKSPLSRGVKNLDERIKRLEEYEKWKENRPYKFEEYVDEDLWTKHWNNHDKLLNDMDKAQEVVFKVKKQIEERIKLD